MKRRHPWLKVDEPPSVRDKLGYWYSLFHVRLTLTRQALDDLRVTANCKPVCPQFVTQFQHADPRRLGLRTMTRRFCVYTALTGNYEKLDEQPVPSNSNIDFIYFH